MSGYYGPYQWFARTPSPEVKRAPLLNVPSLLVCAWDITLSVIFVASSEAINGLLLRIFSSLSAFFLFFVLRGCKEWLTPCSASLDARRAAFARSGSDCGFMRTSSWVAEVHSEHVFSSACLRARSSKTCPHGISCTKRPRDDTSCRVNGHIRCPSEVL